MRLLYSNSHDQAGIHAPTQHLSLYPPTHLYSHQIIHNEQTAMSKIGPQLLPSLYDCPANLASAEYIPSYVQSNKRQSPRSTDSSQRHTHFTKEHLNMHTACMYVREHIALHQSIKSSHQLMIVQIMAMNGLTTSTAGHCDIHTPITWNMTCLH